MQDIQSQKESQNIFKNIELTGEKFKQEFKELAEKAQMAMNSQMNNSKFEAAYALFVNKKQRMKTMSEVKEVRNELWQEALKKSNGDVNDASEIYEKLCSFP
jgi:membrane-associated HD superfamily phosphohydrolase